MEAQKTLSDKIAFDSGAVIAMANGDRKAMAILKGILQKRELVVIPAPVITETLRGNNSDATVHRILNTGRIVPLTVTTARSAGERLGLTGSNATVDAMIVSIAVAESCLAIVTGDPDDISRLADSDLNVIES